MPVPPSHAKREDIRAQLSLLSLVLVANTRGAIPKFSLGQINLRHGAGFKGGNWILQELGWAVRFGRELGRNMSKSGSEIHFSHQFLVPFGYFMLAVGSGTCIRTL